MLRTWVKRTDGSSYFPPHFHNMEKGALEAVAGVGYLGLGEALPSEGDVCLLTNTLTRLPDWEFLRPRVKLVLHPNSGFDNLLSGLEAWDGIPVVLGNPVRAQAVAQWTLAALLQHVVPITGAPAWPTSREWARPLVGEKQILLVGHGLVGQLVQDGLAAMGATARVHDPFKGHAADLRESWDVVILAASLNPTSRHILGKDFFDHAFPELLLINPARGELVDETALRAFLRRCPRARAVLDVHAREPYPAGYWADCPNVLPTPHVAGVWSGLVESMVSFEAAILRDWHGLGPDGFRARHGNLLLENRLTSQGWHR